jgi:hypothetical protein
LSLTRCCASEIRLHEVVRHLIDARRLCSAWNRGFPSTLLGRDLGLRPIGPGQLGTRAQPQLGVHV